MAVWAVLLLVLSENHPTPMEFVGVKGFAESGDYSQLLEKVRFGSKDNSGKGKTSHYEKIKRKE